MSNSMDFKKKLSTRLKGARKDLSETFSTLLTVNASAVAVLVKGASGFMLTIAATSITIACVAMAYAISLFALRRKNAITKLKIEFKQAT